MWFNCNLAEIKLRNLGYMEKFIDIVDLTFSYDNGDKAKNILNGINLKIKRNMSKKLKMYPKKKTVC